MDGVFFYAVMSTGIYCRPWCPSKRPRRENVVFFRAREAAERAGFRPCKRCKPDSTDQRDPNAQLVEKVCRYIDTHPDEPVTLEALGRALGISPFYLQRTFKALTGITPRAYADSRRLNRSRPDLREGHSVTRSLYDAGYGSSSRLYERASSQLGMTPARYRKQGSGVTIHYTIASTPIGKMLLAATDRGICSIHFGDATATLERELRIEYPKAEIIRADGKLGGQVKALRAMIAGENQSGASAGHSGHRVPAARLASAASDSARRDEILQQDRGGHRPSESRSRRGTRLRHQSSGRRDSLSSRGARRWGSGRLPLGRGAQEEATGVGSGKRRAARGLQDS